MLIIKSEAENPQKEVESGWQEYQEDTARKILAHRKLTRSLRLKVKNYLLNKKTQEGNIIENGLNMIEHNWMSLSDHIIKNLNISGDIFEVVKNIYSLQNQFFNIFNNHYTIRNSLDTHFVATKMDLIESTLIEAKLELSKRIYEIENPSVSFHNIS